jgi:hypothetical protein
MSHHSRFLDVAYEHRDLGPQLRDKGVAWKSVPSLFFSDLVETEHRSARWVDILHDKAGAEVRLYKVTDPGKVGWPVGQLRHELPVA